MNLTPTYLMKPDQVGWSCASPPVASRQAAVRKTGIEAVCFTDHGIAEARPSCGRPRKAMGGAPMMRLNARLNDASDS